MEYFFATFCSNGSVVRVMGEFFVFQEVVFHSNFRNFIKNFYRV